MVGQQVWHEPTGPHFTAQNMEGAMWQPSAKKTAHEGQSWRMPRAKGIALVAEQWKGTGPSVEAAGRLARAGAEGS